MQRLSLLWLLSKWPYPPSDGSRVASFSLIRELTSQGVDLDLMILTAEPPPCSPEETKERLGVRSLTTIPTAPVHMSPIRRALQFAVSIVSEPRLPLTVQRFARGTVRKRLSEYLQKNQAWHGVVYEGVHTAAHLAERGIINAGTLPHIYRAQNCESQLWRSRAETENNWLLKKVLLTQTFLMMRLEQSLVQTAAGVAAISPEDATAFQAFSSTTPVRTIPVGLTFETPQPFPESSDLSLLFVGKLDWYPNKDGLLWFLDKVWPHVVQRRPETKLTIIGSGDGGWLQPYATEKNITIKGYVPSLSPFYKEAHVALVPIHYGGGVKIKALEAAQHGRVSLMTPAARPGLCFTPGETTFVAENADEWIKLLTETPTSSFSERGRAAYNHAREYYHPTRAAESFIELLRESLPSLRTKEV